MSISRRGFMGGAAAAAAWTIIPRHALGAAGAAAPSDALNVAIIGTGGRGKNLMEELFRFSDVQIVAIADPNEESDYRSFYYGGTSGRLPVLTLIKDHYGRTLGDKYAGCRDYVDYRTLLEREKEIDAVLVATPDHVHAVACMAAMQLKKHVYCEKPLTHSVFEARTLAETARAMKVATQMGNQGHSGDGIRQICEWIWDGAIGAVREVYSWSDTGYWTTLAGRPQDTPPVPKGLVWDLWIGPAKERPYHPAYAPYNWRGWWDFGTGAIGDMGCHNMDPAFWALKLGHPATIESCSTNLNNETTPNGNIIRYEFPARGDMPPVRLTWFDGGLRPPRPEEMDPSERLDGNGIILIGDKGTILCGGWSNGPRLLPRSRMEAYTQPAPTLPRSNGWMRDWVDACKGGRAASSNFDVGGHLTEVILLGNVALRTGKKIVWDGVNLKALNVPEAEQFINPPYRKGWSL